MRRYAVAGKAPAPRCLRCRLLAEQCICDVIRAAAERLRGAVPTRVVLVTHAYEQTQTSHTGHLVPELLAGAEQRWWARRHPTPDLEHVSRPGARALLLFPAEDAPPLTPEPAAVAAAAGERLTLVVPDGTWRQARRLAGRHPVLAQLPRVALPPGGPPRWTVRRTHREGGVCTLEAVARALGVLHGEAVRSAMEAVLSAHAEAIWGARGVAPPLG